jgi:hypothetical protein
MKNLYTFGAIGAAALVATMLITTTFANAAPAWAVATAATATSQNASTSKLTVTAADAIPRKADVSPDAVAGFAWADLDTGIVLVATIHPTFRDSAQNPDSWHLHAAQLAAPVGYHTFCIDSFFPNPQGGISIQGDVMSVSITNGQMPFATSDIDRAVGFVVNPQEGCGAGLAVDVTAAPVGLS